MTIINVGTKINMRTLLLVGIGMVWSRNVLLCCLRLLKNKCFLELR